ncbi:hypothetical protein F5B19DRAFT_442749 [Rostrohypoxylon terebratum]|nr:hypothetical protein F5B19DRAFT_442749 [Rostrohypoxylon terebratum]
MILIVGVFTFGLCAPAFNLVGCIVHLQGNDNPDNAWDLGTANDNSVGSAWQQVSFLSMFEKLEFSNGKLQVAKAFFFGKCRDDNGHALLTLSGVGTHHKKKKTPFAKRKYYRKWPIPF